MATDLRISAINGAAFLDTDDAPLATFLTANINNKLTLKDSARRVLIGYIKAMGAGEALGAEKVVDGGFAAVTEANVYTSDFSAGEDEWQTFTGVVSGNIDAIGGLDDNLRFTIDDLYSHHSIKKTGIIATGNTYNIKSFDFYVPSGQSHIDGVGSHSAHWNFGQIINSVTDAWTSLFGANWYGTQILYPNFYIYAADGTLLELKDPGADDVFYVRNIVIDSVLFDSWTCGTGWAPATSAGALTNKANATAGTASDLSQDITSTAGKLYKLVFTVTRTAGSVTAKIGGGSGTAVNADGTYTQYITAGADDTNLTFSKDATFAGTVGTVSCKEVTAPSVNGSTIVTAPGGTIFNWQSIQTDFDYNDGTGYTYSARGHRPGGLKGPTIPTIPNRWRGF
jgi:hypothetical protein